MKHESYFISNWQYYRQLEVVMGQSNSWENQQAQTDQVATITWIPMPIRLMEKDKLVEKIILLSG